MKVDEVLAAPAKSASSPGALLAGYLLATCWWLACTVVLSVLSRKPNPNTARRRWTCKGRRPTAASPVGVHWALQSASSARQHGALRSPGASCDLQRLGDDARSSIALLRAPAGAQRAVSRTQAHRRYARSSTLIQ